jgi:Tfp pilus assembly protein PilV
MPASEATKRTGVVLVDVIIGTVILGVALAVLVGILGRSLAAQTDGEQIQTAAMLIDEQLNMVLMRGADNYQSRFETDGVCDPPFGDFRYHLDVSPQTPGRPYSVKATVMWASGGRDRSASVSTMIAPRLGDDPDPLRTLDTPVERLR